MNGTAGRFLLRNASLAQIISTANCARSNGTLTVLGIETSCDDTAVCVLNENKKILSSRRYANREVQKRLGGICPAISAEQHRSCIDHFIEECLDESNLRLCDLSGIAVTNRPGLVISLRVGVEKAVSLARKGRIPLIPVHHMQAHATVATLLKPISYPYVSVIISGGHSIVAVTNGPEDFEALLDSISGSPGECLDKISRQLNLQEPGLHAMHPGAALEVMASRSSTAGHKRYSINVTRFANMALNFNFSWIKATYLMMISQQQNLNIPDFCASVQHSVATYLAEKISCCLQYINDSNKVIDDCEIPFHCALYLQITPRNRLLFVSGGVASNRYILLKLRNVCESLGYILYAPSPVYCCDNAEMIAWNGLQLLRKRAVSVISGEKLPTCIFVSSRSPIGTNISAHLRTYLNMLPETSVEAKMRRSYVTHS